MERLRIYQKALQLVKETYVFISSNKILQRDFSLCDQFKRAAVSVVLNIAEGYGRGSKQYTNYLKIAVGSINEVIAVLQIIQTVYEIDTQHLQNEYLLLGRQTTALFRAFIKKPTND